MPNDQINVLAELERIGQPFKWIAETEVSVLCPFHDDSSPSCTVNIEKRCFKCHTAGCGASGDIVSLLACYLDCSRAIVWADLGTRYSLSQSKTIDPQVVERYHLQLSKALPLCKELQLRGVTPTLARKYRLGEHRGRITIPIPDESGLFINVRRYLPGAPGKDKMRNTRGFGTPRLFPISQLSHECILVTGGEIKAIVAADQLNPHGIGAITATAGEENWDPSFTTKFRNKVVYVCMDVDEPGRVASHKVCRLIAKMAAEVYNVLLPLDTEKHPHGDINDFVVGGGDLHRAVMDAPRWEAEVVEVAEEAAPIVAELVDAVTADNVHKRFKVTALAAAMDDTPYIIPKSFVVDCTRDQKECALCHAYDHEGPIHISPESPGILEMIAAHKSVQREVLMKAAKVPQMCRVCQCTPIDYYNAEDVRISPRLEITSRGSDRIMQPAVCLGPGVELNECYDFIGQTHPHPRTQQSTLVISSYDPADDALSTYEHDNNGELNVFQPEEWTLDSLTEKLAEIYDDFAANVTRIYERSHLHLAIDLGYYSPLFLTFDGRVVKGWAEILIIGDSAQGKSETALNLMKHYQIGEKVECKNASVAGLLGGLQQMGSKWFVTWGIIPTHDKRLVILEELKGASTEVIAKLTDMRSSGVAEIPKIERRRTHARTRLVALSNPRGDRPLASYNYGLEAVKELVGNLEDIRRFDFALLVSAVDIKAETLNRLQRYRPTHEHTYTSDLCHKLVLWSWTREPSDVVFTQEVTTQILDLASELCLKYTDAIPLIDKGSTRHKIARLSAALAARTFSTDKGSDLVVRSCHVEYIGRLLNEVYSSDVFGYDDFTKSHAMAAELVSTAKIRECINGTSHPKDFAESMLYATTMDITDIQDVCACDRSDAQQILSVLVRNRALTRTKRAYRKNPPFITLLKLYIADDTLVDRPDHIPDRGDF